MTNRTYTVKQEDSFFARSYDFVTVSNAEIEDGGDRVIVGLTDDETATEIPCVVALDGWQIVNEVIASLRLAATHAWGSDPESN